MTLTNIFFIDFCFVIHNFFKLPPLPTAAGRDGYHVYVPRQGILNKKQAMWRGAWRLWHIITCIQRENQGFGRETKTRAAHIAYNTVARVYSVVNNILKFRLCENISCLYIFRIFIVQVKNKK